MKIKSTKDIVEVSNRVIELLVIHKKLAIFNLLVDHGDGTLSNCTWTPTAKVAENQSFLAAEDYSKIIVLLATHPRIKDLEYDEKQNAVTAVFHAPEMEDIRRYENYENSDEELPP